MKIKIKKHINNNRHIYRHLRGKSDFVVAIATAEQVHLARKLQADVYLHYKNVSPQQITAKGYLNSSTDPYHKNAVYFVAFNKNTPDKLVGSVRLIMPVNGYRSLQISLEVPKQQVIDRLGYIQDNAIAEVSGLVKQLRAPSIIPLLLLRECYRYSIEHHIDYLFMTVTAEPYHRFRKLFGENMMLLGEPFKIPHGNNIVYPLVIETKRFKEKIGNAKATSLKNHIAHRVLL